MTPERIEEARRRAKDFLAFHEPCRHEGGCLACRRAYDYLALLAEWEEQEKLIRRLALALIDANRLDYPWKAGSRASNALDEAETLLDGEEP